MDVPAQLLAGIHRSKSFLLSSNHSDFGVEQLDSLSKFIENKDMRFHCLCAVSLSKLKASVALS